MAVYFIGAWLYEASGGSADYIKIGTAVDPVARLAQLQIGCPLALRILATMEGDSALESRLHRRFERLRVRGEWFHYGEGDGELIALLAAGEVDWVLDESPWIYKFQRYLSERRLSLDHFHEDTGVSPATMRRILDRAANPTKRVMEAVRGFTGERVSLSDLRRPVVVSIERAA